MNTDITTIEAIGESKDFFVVRNGKICAGEHFIIDIYGADKLNDMAHIETTLRQCVKKCDATLLHIHLHHFSPQGVSGVAVLEESHISVHTWPENGYAAFDVFMCGAAQPGHCVDILRAAFHAERVNVHRHLRGTQIERNARQQNLSQGPQAVQMMPIEGHIDL